MKIFRHELTQSYRKRVINFINLLQIVKINNIYHKLRKRITKLCESENLFHNV